MTHHIGKNVGKIASLTVLLSVALIGCPRVNYDYCSGDDPHPECSRCQGANPDPECGLTDVGPDLDADDVEDASEQDATVEPDEGTTPDAGEDVEDTTPPPCGGACSGATPHCDEATDTCVTCLADAHCPDGVCNDANSCVGCLGDADCTDQVCDTAANECVDCVDSTTCTEVTASVCEANSCAACQVDADCAHLSATPACNEGTCVACTATSDSCNGKVCDVRQNTCTTIDPGVAGLCEECVSDAQCGNGQVCVAMEFEATDGSGPAEVGTFCLAEQAGVGSCASFRPYFKTDSVTTLDDIQTTVCSLRLTTCLALNDFSQASCTTSGADAADECGATGFNDGYCASAGTENLCSTPCGSNLDCRPGFDCNIASPTPHCDL